MGPRGNVDDRYLGARRGMSSQDVPRDFTAVICAVEKDEELYNNEWVDYHLALGFSDIYIYDNSDDSGLLKRWKNVNENKHVHVIPFPGERVQIGAYKDCGMRVTKEKHTWVTFLDVDEFLVLKKHDHVIDFAIDHVPRGHLGINWQIFGTSGRMIYEPYPVTLRFQCRSSWHRNKFVKSLIRVADLGDLDQIRSPHRFPRAPGTFLIDTDKIPFEGSMHDGPRDVALIYHFYYKSFEEHLNKRKRGDVFFGDTKGRGNFTALAKQGLDPYHNKIPPGSIKDSSAWEVLKRMIPKYADFEQQEMQEAENCKSPTNWEVHFVGADLRGEKGSVSARTIEERIQDKDRESKKILFPHGNGHARRSKVMVADTQTSDANSDDTENTSDASANDTDNAETSAVNVETKETEIKRHAKEDASDASANDTKDAIYACANG
eukprot:CAMPEP_0198141830 /NCGR_PEP_ID=MMETSP1443-20131203/4765_1 /TAXON_ID=186043 /ORGANISM="Entomoneis sp., Strain CCMP2396" /LENGTH=433 /DNA_ID=CAMNT_0043804693 /DNA_START=167 /DNA_END=1469 /DNA_ORIENTATION=+